MTHYREILRLASQGISQRSIASSCGCSRNTVIKVLHQANELGIAWPLKEGMADAELKKLFSPESRTPSSRRQPDCENIHREMAKSGVTLSLLWNEYCEECRMNQEIPLMYSQFCYHYQRYAQSTKVTMHIQRKPGEQLEVDWAGQTAAIIDRDTGEISNAYIFVGALSSSQYAYVEAFPSQNQECWIAAHCNMYKFFGGVTRILVPDNLKTGVEKASWYSPEINRTYQEMAEHYGTAVIPARVRRPKDKPNAEGSVKIISTWIIAALRHQRFFTIAELNEAIREKLVAFNSRLFQKKEGSRLSVFLEEEKPFLLPLPASPYELAIWKIATVQFNYHIAVDKMLYSVPYEYIRQKVDLRITRNIVEVFYNHMRICSHPRLHGCPGQYSTVIEHMPEDHKKYTQWNGARFTSWAESVGPHTAITVRSILASYKIEQQGYKSCMALLKLADKYSLPRLEAACAKALSYTPRPGYKNIKTILTTGQDRVFNDPIKPSENSPETYGLTRGAGYYGRDGK